MFRKITVNFDFKQLISRLKSKKLITSAQKREINENIAMATQDFILNNSTEPKVNSATLEIRERIHGSGEQTTMVRSGNLVDSIRGNEDGIEMVGYGKYQLEGFTMRESNFTRKLGIPTPQSVGPFDFLAVDQGVDQDIIDDIAEEIVNILTK